MLHFAGFMLCFVTDCVVTFPTPKTLISNSHHWKVIGRERYV